MIKLKTLLQSKLFIILSIVFVFIISLYQIKNDNIIYKNEVSGIVKNVIKKNDRTNIYIDNILVTYYGDLDIKLGSLIRVEGEYVIPSDNTNFNLFNYNYYLKGNGIKYSIILDKYEVISSSRSIIYKAKNKVVNIINNHPNKEYLKAFLLGDKTSIDQDIINSFTKNGISHLFAISGMHVSLLSVIIFAILNKIRKTDFNYIIVFIFLLFYSFLVNNTPSILRSVYFFLLCFINKKTIKISNNYLLIYLFLIFLLFNPFYLYNIGFIYSFTISYFLIKYGSITNNRPYIIRILLTSFIAFIVSIPISINNYFSINLLSIINNIIFVPFVSIILFPLILISFIFSFLNPLLTFFINILEWLSINLSNFSINLTLCHISWYYIIIYYLIIIFILEMLKKNKYYFIILIYIVLLLHSFVLSMNFYNEVHVLDVGQGDSILLRLKNNSILIDTGGKVGLSSYSIVSNTTIPYLKSLGIKKLDYLVLTHGDYDHMGEAINLVNNFKVDKVILNCGEFNELESNLIEVLNKKNIPYYSCIKELNVDNSKLYFLVTKEYDNENDNSNVIYTDIDGYKFMFMGDAGAEKEKDILSKYNISNIDVLKVGHHGSKTSSSYEFIDKMNPNYSIISVGKNNRYGHPNKEVLNNLEHSKIYRTDKDRSIMFKIKNNKLKVETCSP